MGWRGGAPATWGVNTCWRGMRVAAVDGFVLDVPDTEVNRAAFGGPVDANRTVAAWPPARDGPGRRDLPGADRPGRAEGARPRRGPGAGDRIPRRRRRGRRELTDLMDPAAFPVGELAARCHQRWESESSFRHAKRSSAARRKSCGQRTRSWSVRRHGRIWRCTTA